MTIITELAGIKTSESGSLDAANDGAVAVALNAPMTGDEHAVARQSLVLAQAESVRRGDEPITVGVIATGPRVLPNKCCGWSRRPGEFEEPDPVGNQAPLYDILGVQHLLRKRGVEHRLVVKEGKPSELNRLAAELVQSGVDVMVGIGTSGVTAAQSATTTVPILFPNISDPVLGGFVKSQWKPGGNITGTSARLEQLTPQRLNLMKMIMGDRLTRVMVLHRPDYPPALRAVELLREEAARLGIDIVSSAVSTRAGIQEALGQISERGVDGIIMVPEAFIAANNDLVVNAANEHRIPFMGVHDYLADWGAIGSLGTFPHGAGQELARGIMRIKTGERPADMPVLDLPPYFVVNLKAAKYLGIRVPDEVLRQADRVIPEDA